MKNMDLFSPSLHIGNSTQQNSVHTSDIEIVEYNDPVSGDIKVGLLIEGGSHLIDFQGKSIYKNTGILVRSEDNKMSSTKVQMDFSGMSVKLRAVPNPLFIVLTPAYEDSPEAILILTKKGNLCITRGDLKVVDDFDFFSLCERMIGKGSFRYLGLLQLIFKSRLQMFRIRYGQTYDENRFTSATHNRLFWRNIVPSFDSSEWLIYNLNHREQLVDVTCSYNPTDISRGCSLGKILENGDEYSMLEAISRYTVGYLSLFRNHGFQVSHDEEGDGSYGNSSYVYSLMESISELYKFDKRLAFDCLEIQAMEALSAYGFSWSDLQSSRDKLQSFLVHIIRHFPLLKWENIFDPEWSEKSSTDVKLVRRQINSVIGSIFNEDSTVSKRRGRPPGSKNK